MRGVAKPVPLWNEPPMVECLTTDRLVRTLEGVCAALTTLPPPPPPPTPVQDLLPMNFLPQHHSESEFPRMPFNPRPWHSFTYITNIGGKEKTFLSPSLGKTLSG